MKKNGKLLSAVLWNLGKLERIRFWYMASRVDARVLNSLNVFLHSIASMIILGTAAHLTSWSLIFPSLGPTIFLIFYAPSSAMSAPRNTIAAHVAGAFIGWACFQVLLFMDPSAASLPHTALPRIITASIALGFCGILMSLSGIVHPPAASTTLVAGLGMINSPMTVAFMTMALILLCMLAWTMHWLSGIKYPAWAPFDNSQGPLIHTKLGKLTLSGPSDKDRVKDVAARLASRQRLK